jgi:hypothetical protein
MLETMEKDKLVILADARDVILNVPANEAVATLKIDNFIETFANLRKNSPNAVVMSAEAQCCVAAMAHNAPYDYFNQNTKERAMRACPSGADNCPWFPSEHIEDWQNWMKERAFKTTGKDASDVYLNAGLMAGYPDDLLNLLNVADLNPSEDDQAVFSGLMHEFPDMIVLDYEAELFGNNQWTRGLKDGCVFKSQGENLSLFHTETENEPVFLHTSGRFYDCLDMLIEELGGVSQQRYLQDAMAEQPAVGFNYGGGDDDDDDDDDDDASGSKKMKKKMKKKKKDSKKMSKKTSKKSKKSTKKMKKKTKTPTLAPTTALG